MKRFHARKGDKRYFKKTAKRVKAINATQVPRGGYRL